MAKRETVLVVDDDSGVRLLLKQVLETEGFEVVLAADGRAGLDEALRRPPALILLDQGLPQMAGSEVCRELRQSAATRGVPIIFLTGRREVTDIAIGLGLGADDYVSKPFQIPELVARIRALLRRTRPGQSASLPTIVTAGALTLDASRLEGQANGLTLSFSVAEFKILFTLAESPGVVFSRDQILDRMNHGSVVVSDRTVDVHINSIRKKLASLGDCIETVRGAGYRFRNVR